MDEVRIWHNPRCSKSRETLALLRGRGIDPVVVEYLRTPPTGAEIDEALTLLGLAPRDLLRKKEKAYEDLGLADRSLSDTALVKAMADHPVLIERPIVFAGGKAALGRPPEAVLAVL